LLVGTELGTGEFGIVSEVDAICIDDDCDCDCALARGALPLASVLREKNSSSAVRNKSRSRQKPTTVTSISTPGPANVLQSPPPKMPPQKSILSNTPRVCTSDTSIKSTNSVNSSANPSPKKYGMRPSVSFSDDTKRGKRVPATSVPSCVTSVFASAYPEATVSDYDGRSCCDADGCGDDEFVDDYDHNEAEDVVQIMFEEETIELANTNTRLRMASNTHRDGMARYAIKRLNPSGSDKGVIDLACEAMFLRSRKTTGIYNTLLTMRNVYIY
jgi:hypothetical protein